MEKGKKIIKDHGNARARGICDSTGGAVGITLTAPNKVCGVGDAKT